MNFKEILDCLIEREERIKTELTKPDYLETMDGTLLNGGNELDRKIDEKGNVYFFVDFPRCFSLFLTPEQMKAYICYENPSWNKEIEKMINKNPDASLHAILHTWFWEHPGIANKLLTSLTEPDNKHLSKKDVQDDPFDIYAPQDIFNGESWYGMMKNHFMMLGIILHHESQFIADKTKGKLLSRFDQFVLMFREELGVRSLKEIESLESAICYLLYRHYWIIKHRDEIKMSIGKTKTYNAYLDYISPHPDHSTFDFFSSRNGFNGELWASYDEFIHDEWLDDSFAEQLENENIITIYENICTLALKKIS